MEKLATWREMLGQIIRDTSERQRIAGMLDVSSVTLMRWANNTSSPRPQKLSQLLEALPEHRSSLRELILAEFPDLSTTAQAEEVNDALEEIPSEFYARVINAFTTELQSQCFWSISNLILQQVLGQLDPDLLGLAITIVQCMPPSHEGKIRSLRERVGHGTPPWGMNLEQHAIFLGQESLAGYVVINCRERIIQRREVEQGIFPAHWVEWEKSAAAYPIMRAGYIAGCLLVSSTQPDYFLPLRCHLIQRYTELIGLAFEPEEFYPPQHINLQPMPFYHEQEKYLKDFRERVSTTMTEALRNHQSLNLLQAQQVVWQQLEEELLQLAAQTAQ